MATMNEPCLGSGAQAALHGSHHALSHGQFPRLHAHRRGMSTEASPLCLGSSTEFNGRLSRMTTDEGVHPPFLGRTSVCTEESDEENADGGSRGMDARVKSSNTWIIPRAHSSRWTEPVSDGNSIRAFQKNGFFNFLSENDQILRDNLTRPRSNSFPCTKCEFESVNVLKPRSATWDKDNSDVEEEKKVTTTPVRLPRKTREVKVYTHAERRRIMEGEYTTDMIYLTKDVAENDRTTVMMRNLPNKYDHNSVIELLWNHNFGDKFDFLYLPIDFRSKSNTGYCFINFIDASYTRQFKKMFAGFDGWSSQSVKKCEVSWSTPFQGLAAHIDRYRNSPMMHESVPATYKPCLYCQGQYIPFPQPFRPVGAPKMRIGSLLFRKTDDNSTYGDNNRLRRSLKNKNFRDPSSSLP